MILINPEKSNHLRLSDIFEIIQGVPNRLLKSNNGPSGHYLVITSSNVPSEPYMPINGELNELTSSEVENSKIINEKDFLLTNKQVIKGFEAVLIGKTKYPVVPNENIFILRPRDFWFNKLFPNYLKFLFAELIKSLDHFAESKSMLKKSQKYITIKDLSEIDFEIDIIRNAEIEDEIAETFKDFLSAYDSFIRLKNEIKKIDISIDLKINISPSRLHPKNESTISLMSSQIDSLVHFRIRLGKTYYLQPMLNIGADYEQYFGEHGNMLKVYFNSYNSIPISATINRLANPNKTPRILFKGNDYNRYIQAKYQIGDAIKITIDKEYQNSILIE